MGGSKHKGHVAAPKPADYGGLAESRPPISDREATFATRGLLRVLTVGHVDTLRYGHVPVRGVLRPRVQTTGCFTTSLETTITP